MKKSKLVIDYEFDFEVYGIISSSKGYKLAWELNHQLGIHLVKQPDLIVGGKNGRDLCFSYYAFDTAVNRLKLFRNKCYDQSAGKDRLVPEHPHLDYILLSKLDEQRFSEPMSHLLKTVQGIELVTPLNLAPLKSKTNFVF